MKKITGYGICAIGLIALVALWVIYWLTPGKVQVHNANFGERATLVSSIHSNKQLRAGEALNIEVTWDVGEGLAEGKSFSYHIRNGTGGVVVKDIRFKPGEYPKGIYSETVSLLTPEDAQPGWYEVVAFIYPFDDYELKTTTSSEIYDRFYKLFSTRITH